MKRIILKIGTSSLTQGSPRISRGKIEDLAVQLSTLRLNYEIVLVSSGAIAAAKQFASVNGGESTASKQAMAAIGQVHLMRFYQEIFKDYDLPVAQCLLTYYDFNNDESRSNIIDTIDTLIRYDYIPIINENDTVATDEIKFGDNDKLAALTAVLCKADLLVLATDTEGVFNMDPKSNEGAVLIEQIEDLKPHLATVAHTKSNQGSGGMKSKLEAAEIAQKHGVPTWIVNGGKPNFLVDALNGSLLFTEIKI